MMCRWEHREKRRYYEVHFSRDLFGDWVVTRVWGGIDSARGQIRHTPVDPERAGWDLIEAIGRRRQQRGYRPR